MRKPGTESSLQARNLKRTVPYFISKGRLKEEREVKGRSARHLQLSADRRHGKDKEHRCYQNGPTADHRERIRRELVAFMGGARVLSLKVRSLCRSPPRVEFGGRALRLSY